MISALGGVAHTTHNLRPKRRIVLKRKTSPGQSNDAVSTPARRRGHENAVAVLALDQFFALKNQQHFFDRRATGRVLLAHLSKGGKLSSGRKLAGANLFDKIIGE